ncbi:hypothetical protein BDFB_002655 [Asbolus verrucosus]|uniref:Uncharacterized protein n=1 Tax=Asbolus verrucosus TaxID=1661398 RepID=A0A482VDG1_ASBVE|nr:hypothetical protein BDFB_002655 [Asbolus verrucosus]
MDSRLGSE